MILPPVPSSSSSSSLSLGPLSLARTELSLDSPELAHRIIQSAFSTNQEKECHVGLESESEFKLDVPLVASSTHDQSKSLPFISAFISAVDKLTRVGDLRLKSMQNNWVVPPESDALQSKRLPSIPLQSLLGVFAEDPAWRDELLVLSHIFIDRLNTHFQQKYSYFLSSFSIHRVTIASLKLAAENQETALHSSRWERFVSANELTRMLSQLKAHLPSEGFDPEEFQRHFAHLKALTLSPTSPAFPRPLTRMGARADSIDSAASTASHATFDCSFQLSVPSEEEEDDDMSEPPQMMSLTIKLSPHDNSMAFSTPSLSSLSGEGSLVTSSSRRRKPEPEEGREGEGEGDSEDEDKEYHVYVFGDASSVSTSHSHSHMQAQASGDHTSTTTDTDMDEAIARHWYQMQIRALPPRKSKSKNKTQKKHKSSRGAGSVTSYSSADADSAEHMSTGSFSVASFPLASPAAGAHFASPSFSFSLAAPRPLPIPMSASMAMQSSEFARLRDMSMNMGSLGMGMGMGMGIGFGFPRFSSGAASSSSSASVAPLPIPPASSIAMSRYDIAKDLASRHSF